MVKAFLPRRRPPVPHAGTLLNKALSPSSAALCSGPRSVLRTLLRSQTVVLFSGLVAGTTLVQVPFKHLSSTGRSTRLDGSHHNLCKHALFIAGSGSRARHHWRHWRCAIEAGQQYIFIHILTDPYFFSSSFSFTRTSRVDGRDARYARLWRPLDGHLSRRSDQRHHTPFIPNCSDCESIPDHQAYIVIRHVNWTDYHRSRCRLCRSRSRTCPLVAAAAVVAFLLSR